MASRVHVGKLDEIPPGSVRLVQAGPRPLAVFRLEKALVAVDDRCPHRAGPLSEGALVGSEITCPWHGSRFDLSTGKKILGPSVRDLTCFEVVVENGEVWVELP